MDIFNIGARFGSLEFFKRLHELMEDLLEPARFLTTVQMEILARLIPMRHVGLLFSPLTYRLRLPECTELPRDYDYFLRLDRDADEPVMFAVAEVLVVLLSDASHFSALVLDMVDRVAYHFDSFPDSGHGAIAAATCASLARLGALASAELGGCVHFRQRDTECGLYVLMAATNIEQAMMQRGTTPRAVAIMDALRASADPDAVLQVRMALEKRISWTFLLLYNARPDNTQPESLEQKTVLGPACNRVAVQRLCKNYQPSMAQLVAALELLSPAGMSVFAVTLNAESRIELSPEQCTEARRSRYTLFTSATADGVVEHAFVMITRDEQQPPLLFVPAHRRDDRRTAHWLPQLARQLGAVQAEIGVEGFSRTDSTAALPLMILQWWSANGILVADEDLGDRTLQLARRLPIPGVRRPDDGHDWFYRQLIAVTLDAGYRLLLEREQLRQELGPAQVDPFDAVRQALGHAPLAMRSDFIEHRQREAEQVEVMDKLGECVETAIDLVNLHAPPRWKLGETEAELRQLYYYHERTHLIGQQVWSAVTRVVNLARRAADVLGRVHGPRLAIMPLIAALYRAWPVGLMLPLGLDGALVGVPFAGDQFEDGITYMLDQKPGDPLPLLLCPVLALEHGDLYTPVSMHDAVRMANCDLCPRARVAHLPAGYVDSFQAEALLGGRGDPGPVDVYTGQKFTRDELSFPTFHPRSLPLFYRTASVRDGGVSLVAAPPPEEPLKQGFGEMDWD